MTSSRRERRAPLVEPEPLRRLPLQAEHLAAVRQAMVT